MQECPFKKHFTPHYPKPYKSKSSFAKLFIRGWKSWLHVLFEKSYTMKTGQVKLPGYNVYMVNEPKLVKQVMVSDVNNFPKHHIMHKTLEPLLGSSIFTTNGAIWQRQRYMMGDAFTHTNLKKVFPLMKESMDEQQILYLEQFYLIRLQVKM